MKLFFAILMWLTASAFLALNQYINMYCPYKEGVITKRLLILTTAVSIAIDLLVIWRVYDILF